MMMMMICYGWKLSPNVDASRISVRVYAGLSAYAGGTPSVWQKMPIDLLCPRRTVRGNIVLQSVRSTVRLSVRPAF